MYKIIITLISIILLLVVSKQNDMIRLMDKCISYSDQIMDNNGVWDKDSSDCMSDYLNLRYELDSIILDGFHKRYNSDNQRVIHQCPILYSSRQEYGLGIDEYIKYISVHNNTLAHSNIMNNQGNESMSKSDTDYKNKVEFSTEDVLELFST